MSWLGLDDGLLEHPKFIRAVNIGGSAAVHLWLGLLSYCGRHLTDGRVPADMVDEVRGPRGVPRDKALAALLQVGLVSRLEGGDLELHDYLEWNPSRDEVLRKRAAARDRQAKSRGMSQRDSARSHDSVTPSVTTPHPIPSHPDPTPVSPPPGVQPARRQRLRSADPPDFLAADWMPEQAEIEAQATRWKATEDQIRRTIPEFRRFWIGEQKRKNKAGWLQAWRNRLGSLAKRSELWVDDLRQVQPRFGKPHGLVVHEQYGVPISQDKAAAIVASVRRKQES